MAKRSGRRTHRPRRRSSGSQRARKPSPPVELKLNSDDTQNERLCELMCSELEFDKRQGAHKTYERLTERDAEAYDAVLQTALNEGDCVGFVEALRRLLPHNKKNHAMSDAWIIYNRYRMRAECLLALNSGNDQVTVFRMRESNAPRVLPPDDRIGQVLDAARVLEQGRNWEFTEFPFEYGSGLSVQVRD